MSSLLLRRCPVRGERAGLRCRRAAALAMSSPAAAAAGPAKKRALISVFDKAGLVELGKARAPPAAAAGSS